jgi:hypothetical protein
MYVDMASVLIVVRDNSAWSLHSIRLRQLIPSCSEKPQVAIKIQ